MPTNGLILKLCIIGHKLIFFNISHEFVSKISHKNNKKVKVSYLTWIVYQSPHLDGWNDLFPAEPMVGAITSGDYPV